MPFAAALRTAAHRFLVASICFPTRAALKFRFGFSGSALAFFNAAQRFRWAAAMRLANLPYYLQTITIGKAEVQDNDLKFPIA